MKKFLTAILATSVLFLVNLNAQELTDSTSIALPSVFETLPGSVTIHQSEAVKNAMDKHVQRNARLTALGLADQSFSIRIFSDNGQNARSQWDSVAESFKNRFPGVPVAKTFDEPFFKVTVGNYMTKAEANAALKRIQPEYPTAFIVRN